jgi:high-affinity nickel permease
MMQRVYLWAVGDASRRMRANVAVTSTSIALAVAIGSYEILHGLA